ncbi:MutS domain V [Colletotrichum orchidophilum]|uniref:DNA mismatch repair protein MSH3 n=1 Tax=Colletotrichum orchidophilum TaxID=1209926 RepID=A0A1G4BAX5_9PEZI|nr:MutS domain V [Colletotrichum orchidophilum]OHE98466.1 MutS domain V [Colletotrichum orchidophilum]
MDPRYSRPSRPSTGFLTTPSQTPAPYGRPSPYFSQTTSRTGTASANPRVGGSYTATPMPSSAEDPVSGDAYTSSYDYRSEPSGTISRSRTTRPSTSYTSRTSRTPFLPNSDKHTIVCALSEARGVTPAVGIVFFNIDTGEVILSQISDNRFFVRTLHKLQIMEPTHLLIVSSCCPPNPKSRLYSHIEEHMPDTTIKPLDRKYWSEIDGLSRIQTFAFREDAEAVKVAIEGSFYATCSFAAAMSFLEIEFSIRVVPHSLRIRYQPSEDTMMIDVSAIMSLEVLQNRRQATSNDSLFGVIKHTLTPMGGRVLRSNLLQPSTLKESYLEPRYDALEELLANHDMFAEVRTALKAFPDVESMLTKLVIIPNKPSVEASERAINHILLVKTFIDAVPAVFQALGPAASPLLSKIRDLCRPELTGAVRELVYQSIHEDVHYAKSALDLRNQRTFAPGINGLLDVARQAYKENTDDVHKHVEELNREHSIDASLRFDNGRKYSLRMRAVDFEDRAVPAVLVNQTMKGRHIECLTMHLKKLNQRIADSVAEVVMLSDKVIQDLIDSIRTQLQPLYRVCDSIALLDMITSFAQASSTYDWTRPGISDTLALKAARHPIMDKTLKGGFVPNDYYATEEHRFQIVTGCNMSGKSTYIKSISLLQIMAQIGCFVPAEYASFPIVHSIFARVTTDDNIESNMSSFSLEMREMAFILSNVTHRSIVIIDELGRATSTRDGLAIAIAIAEALIQSRAIVWFATHFTEIADVLADRPGVLNLHLITQVSTTDNNVPKMTMMYKVESGKTEELLYGITLAKAMAFPKRFLEVAEQVATSLRERREQNKQSSQARKMLNRRKLILNLHEQLKQVSNSEMDESSMRSYLIRLREEFVLRMDVIENGGNQSSSTISEATLDEEDDEFDDEDVFDAVDVESLWSS